MAWVLFAQQNTIKTAFRFSIIDFYFVTGFYSLYDICMARNQKFFKLRTTCKAKAAGDSSVSNGFFSWLSQNSTNLII